jgi:hypothetical protein
MSSGSDLRGALIEHAAEEANYDKVAAPSANTRLFLPLIRLAKPGTGNRLLGRVRIRRQLRRPPRPGDAPPLPMTPADTLPRWSLGPAPARTAAAAAPAPADAHRRKRCICAGRVLTRPIRSCSTACSHSSVCGKTRGPTAANCVSWSGRIRTPTRRRNCAARSALYTCRANRRCSTAAASRCSDRHTMMGAENRNVWFMGEYSD